MSAHPVPVVLGHSYPRHAAAFAFARGEAAAMIRRGVWRHRAVLEALRIMILSIDPADLSPWPACQAIEHDLACALSNQTVGAVIADTDVARAVAPLLDARAAPGAVRRTSRSAAAGRIENDEIEIILRREAAWWVRLHAVLPDESHAA